MIHVLDHGFVRLVDHMGNDLSIVRAARVSYDAAWRAGEDEGADAKLINFLWRNQHTTPFEAVTFTFEVKAPIFVLRQWHRHRCWSYNELSARYQGLPEEFYMPDAGMIGKQSEDNKQVRVITSDNSALRPWQLSTYLEHCRHGFAIYKDLLAQGWPRELARCVLPLATYSHMFATVDLLNLFKFIKLRDHPHAQLETREYARAMKQLIQPIVPVALAAFDEGHK